MRSLYIANVLRLDLDTTPLSLSIIVVTSMSNPIVMFSQQQITLELLEQQQRNCLRQRKVRSLH